MVVVAESFGAASSFSMSLAMLIGLVRDPYLPDEHAQPTLLSLSRMRLSFAAAQLDCPTRPFHLGFCVRVRVLSLWTCVDTRGCLGHPCRKAPSACVPPPP